MGIIGLTRRARALRTRGQAWWAKRSHSFAAGSRSSTRSSAVVMAGIADAGLVEPAGPPLAAVDIDLHVVGDPSLDAHMHEPELGVHQIQVVVQALALAAVHGDRFGLKAFAYLESHAGL